MKLKNLKGKTFGRLTVIERAEVKEKTKSDRVYWRCLCECGNYKNISSKDLLSQGTSSCGCLQSELAKESIQKVNKQKQYLSKEKKKTIFDKMVETKKETLYKDGASLPHLKKEIGSNNKSGVKGVSWDKGRSKWQVEITLKGKRKFLGRYEDKNEAIKARKKAEEEYFEPLLTDS